MIGRTLLDTTGLSVVSHITNADRTLWCRTWSDGWKEQGGIITPQNGTINYLVPFKDNKYSAFLQYADNLSSTLASSVYASMGSRNEKSFNYYRQTTNLTSWYACGF